MVTLITSFFLVLVHKEAWCVCGYHKASFCNILVKRMYTFTRVWFVYECLVWPCLPDVCLMYA